ncbi:MAG: sodium-dependent bicarbonate transport family permease [Phycisphaerales bacterium JB064]
MDPTALTQNLLSPPILFFALGMLATIIRSDLTVPPAVAKALSIYLLVSIGFHGGYELHHSGLTATVITTLGVAALSSAVLPVLGFLVLRLKIKGEDAAGIAACYGSVSAVTFITAISFLERSQTEYSGHLIAAMALMESPAIVTGIVLASLLRMKSSAADDDSQRPEWRAMAHEALANSAIVLLLGSLVIGYVCGESGWATMKPLVKDPFQAVLCLFLLDMGLVAARRLGDLRRSGAFLVGFALLAPPVQASIGIAASRALGLSQGDALLLAVLFGSASYIAAPAALRLALPKANPSLYVPMSLGLTFPFNIVVGIPLYAMIIQWWWPS